MAQFMASKHNIDSFEVGDLIKNRDNFIFHYGIVVNEYQVFIFGCKSTEDMTGVVWLESIDSRIWHLAESKPKFPPQEIVNRCKEFARRLKVEPMQYNFFTNNCEHIARYLVEGERSCTQMSISGVRQGILEFVRSRLISAP